MLYAQEHGRKILVVDISNIPDTLKRKNNLTDDEFQIKFSYLYNNKFGSTRILNKVAYQVLYALLSQQKPCYKTWTRRDEYGNT